MESESPEPPEPDPAPESESEPVVSEAWRGLTATDRDVLLALARRGRGTAKHVRGAIGAGEADVNLVSRRLHPLEDDGLVTAEPATDRPGRGSYWTLTDAGWDVIYDAPVTAE